MENFILNLDKPKGLCSTRVGTLLKQKWRQKRVGHLGTLDPFATGVLPLFGGKYTRLIPYFEAENKTYIATIWLGADSATLDIQSKVSYAGINSFALTKILEVLKSFQGAISQEAPIYSALKYKGKPQYYYARKNIAITPKTRIVTLFSLDLLYYKHPKIKVEICCSKGCYIRSLARDIGKKLGTTAILEQLERTKIGEQFTKKNIVCLDELLKKDYNRAIMLDPWNLLNSYSLVNITTDAVALIKKGIKVKVFSKLKEQEKIFVFSEKALIAAGTILKYQKELFFQPTKLFVETDSKI